MHPVARLICIQMCVIDPAKGLKASKLSSNELHILHYPTFACIRVCVTMPSFLSSMPLHLSPPARHPLISLVCI